MVFDIVIFGYRNDLARARTLEFLNQLPLSESGPAKLDRETAMPQRLFAAMEKERAQNLCSQLEHLGAQVAFLEAGTPTSEAPAVEPAAPRSSLRLTTLILVFVLAAAAYAWRSTAPAVHPPPAARRELKAPLRVLEAAPLEPLRAQSVSSDEPAAVRVN